MRKILNTAAVAACTIAIVAASGTPALASGGFHFLALRAPGDAHSVFVSGTGWTGWSTGGGLSGQVGSAESPTELDACYQYLRGALPGDWARGGTEMQIYTNQGGGRQGIDYGDQHSDPRWQDAKNITVTALTSPDCTSGAITKQTIPVPTDGNKYFWLSVSP